MCSYVVRQLEQRFESKKNDAKDVKHSKSIIALTLKDYLKGVSNEASLSSLIGLNYFSPRATIRQAVLYTTSSIAFPKSSSVLQHLRTEHDTVLGPSANIALAIAQNLHLFSQLSFTHTVIKETLRLFPSVSSIRAGEAGFAVVKGRMSYPTEGCLVWSIHQAIHRDPAYWPSPDDFIPNRWLVALGDPLYPVKRTWRPFEFGPRNCIDRNWQCWK